MYIRSALTLTSSNTRGRRGASCVPVQGWAAILHLKCNPYTCARPVELSFSLFQSSCCSDLFVLIQPSTGLPWDGSGSLGTSSQPRIPTSRSVWVLGLLVVNGTDMHSAPAEIISTTCPLRKTRSWVLGDQFASFSVAPRTLHLVVKYGGIGTWESLAEGSSSSSAFCSPLPQEDLGRPRSELLQQKAGKGQSSSLEVHTN